MGPVKNPWTLLFQKIPHRYRFRAQTSCSHHDSFQQHTTEDVLVKKRGLHTSVSQKLTHLHTALQSSSQDDQSGLGLQRLSFEDDSDWLVAGGSSGGSAAAVASGCALV